MSAVVTGPLAGQRVLVTGGSAGIGAAIARAAMAAGASVASLDRSSDGADPAMLTVVADVTDDASVRAAVAEVAEQLGGLDGLVNNAGIGARGRVEESGDDDWARVLDVNVVGVARVTRAALPWLAASATGGSVVTIGSIAGWSGIPDRAVYSASKGAVHALSLAMAADLAVVGVRVNVVAPGTVDTEMARGHIAAAPDPDQALMRMDARQPMGRMVHPDEVALAVCQLLDPRAGSTTGSIVAVDGGMWGLRVPPPSQA